MSKKPWMRTISVLTAVVLLVGGVAFGSKLTQIQSEAASTSGMPVSHAGVDPNWQTISGWQAVWQVPLDEESLYWVINRTGSVTGSQIVLWAAYDWSADMSTYSTRAVLRVEKTLGNSSGGTDILGPVFSTSAMARIGGTKADPAAPLTVYFWDYEVQAALGDLVCASGYTPIVRATSEQPDLEWSCLPTPYGTRYSAGGEADQYTGNIYMIPGGGSIDDQSSSSTAPSTEGNWRFVVWDPVGGSYSLSYSVQPGDWEADMATVPQERVKLHTSGDGSGDYNALASYDISLDSDGNAYTYSGIDPSTGGDGNMSIVRMEPARDQNGNIVDGTTDNPWRYYVVTKIARENTSQSWSSPSSIYGNGIVNGQLILGANTRVNATGLPATASAGGRGTTTMVRIDPQSAMASVVYSVNNTDLATSEGYDNASSQGAEVIRGTLYQDLNADGAITDGEPGLSNETVALYNGSGRLLSVQQTDSMGQYSFLIASVTGADTVFYVRPVEVTALLPDGVTRVNGAQTWGAGSVATGLSVNKVPLVNTAEIQCLEEGNITSSDGGPCSGARPTTMADPAAGALGSVSDPALWLTYAKVVFNTGQYVPTADFGFTARGSFGDAPAGPLAGDVPMHANVPSTLWLGETLGSYAGPAADTSVHPSDDGVYLDSYAGGLVLEGTILASGNPYRLGADVSGPAADQAHVAGWVTSANTNLWNTAAVWTPSVTHGKAAGDIQVSGAGSVQLRVDASEKAISLPTNAAKEYYGAGMWTTGGEIEDYGFTLADAVVRPAAVTSKGEVGVIVAGQEIAASPTLSIGDAIGATGGEATRVSVSAPDSDWTVTDIAVRDTVTGDQVYRPEFTPGSAVTFVYTPESGSDVVIEAAFAPSIDLEASTLTLNRGTARVGDDITATATIVDSMGDPVPGVIVTFDHASSDTTLGAPTCVTKEDGTCEVTITSTVPGAYPDELSATVDGKPFTGSPQSVVFTHGDLLTLSFAVTPSVDPSDENRTDWRVADGADSYQGVLTAVDQYGNQVSDLVISQIQFSRSSTDVRMSGIVGHGDGTYSVLFTSTTASSDTTAAVSYQGVQVGDTWPIPFAATPTHEIIASVTAGPSPQTVGDPVTITVTVTDENGDPVTGLSEDDVTVTGTADGLPDLVMSGFEEAEPGVYTWTTTSTVVGEFEVAASVLDGDPVSTDVAFVAGAPDLMASRWVVIPLGPLVVGTGDANAYTAAAVVVDKGGNPVVGVEVRFAVTGSGPVFVGGSSCETGSGGMCQVRLSSTVAGAYPITAVTDFGALTNQTTSQPAASVAWRPDQGCVSSAGCTPDPLVPPDRRTRMEVTRDNQIADGTAEDIVTVHVYDRWGNPVSDVPVADPSSGAGTMLTGAEGIATIVYTSTVAGSHSTNVSVGGAAVTDVALTFVPGPVCWAGCVPRGEGTDPGKQTRVVIVNNDALVNQDDSVAVYAFDQYGNAVEGQVFTFVTDDPNLRFGGSDQSTITVVTDREGAGTWTVTSAVAGAYPVRVFIDGSQLPGPPLELRFQGPPTISGPADGEKLTTSEVTITGTGQTDGDTIIVTEDGIDICTAEVHGGVWSCQATMADGGHTLIAVETTPGGTRSGPSGPVSFTIDTSAPTPGETSTGPEPSQTSVAPPAPGETSTGPEPSQTSVAPSTSSQTPTTPSPLPTGSSAPMSPAPTGPTSVAAGPASPRQTPPTPYSQAPSFPPGGQSATAIPTGGLVDESSRLFGLAIGLMTATIGLWAGVKVSRRRKEGGR